jgi:hypothetical protein
MEDVLEGFLVNAVILHQKSFSDNVIGQFAVQSLIDLLLVHVRGKHRHHNNGQPHQTKEAGQHSG